MLSILCSPSAAAHARRRDKRVPAVNAADPRQAPRKVRRFIMTAVSHPNSRCAALYGGGWPSPSLTNLISRCRVASLCFATRARLSLTAWSVHLQHQPKKCRTTNEPCRVEAKAQQGDCTRKENQRRPPVCNRGPSQLPGHHSHKGQRPNYHSIQDCRRHRRTSKLGYQWPTNGNKQESRQEDTQSRDHGTRYPGDQVANKGGSREDRAGSKLPHRHRVDQLLFRQPMQMFDEFCPEKCEQHISASKHDRADLQE